ncbi:DNA primase large subunit [Diachasma alloeum]|uniref:DNA primase large subunit n=1 Tax=Diachasma alloeum TaxID=454923 RepID=UPI0007381328|nr:DNA primase large subunit [Diachasma alloeum]
MSSNGENAEIMLDNPDETDYIPFLPSYDLPKDKIHLYRLEELVNARLLVLFSVKSLNRSTSSSLSEKKAKLIELLEKHHLDHYLWLLTHNGVDPGTEEHQKHLEEEKLAHIYTHAVFSCDTAITDFLVKQEQLLFKFQIMSYEIPQVMEFLERNGIAFPEATPREKKTLRGALHIHWNSDKPRDPLEKIYKVPWLSSADLLRRGEALLHEGICYIPESKMKGVLPTLFDKHLDNERKMELYKLVATVVLTRDQAVFLRASLIPTFRNKKRYTRDIQFDMKNLDRDVGSFPPCIRTILDSWNKKNQLKYDSRQQLWRFFLGLQTNPVALESHMKKTFKVPESKMKEYIYEMRHTFGLVGSKFQYKTPDCSFYNHGPTRFAEVDGCPFTNVDSGDIEDLGTKLTEWNIPARAHLEILDHKANGHCSKACGAFFTAIHGVEPRQEILNPLDFYAESMEALNMNSTTDLEREELGSEFFDKLFKSSHERYTAVLDEAMRLETVRECLEEQPLDEHWDFDIEEIERMNCN